LIGSRNTTPGKLEVYPCKFDGTCAFLSFFQIGADGFRSLVRQTANINTIGYEYDHSAIVATLHLAEVCLIIE
jgi:hypothetical protein